MVSASRFLPVATSASRIARSSAGRPQYSFVARASLVPLMRGRRIEGGLRGPLRASPREASLRRRSRRLERKSYRGSVPSLLRHTARLAERGGDVCDEAIQV